MRDGDRQRFSNHNSSFVKQGRYMSVYIYACVCVVCVCVGGCGCMGRNEEAMNLRERDGVHTYINTYIDT